jgi:16S rRNA C1402 N4-methylase RsmH
MLTKKPIIPSKTEFEDNPRCRSAHLRVFER